MDGVTELRKRILKTNESLQHSQSLERAQKKADANSKRHIPEPYLKTAQSMEQQFAEFMLQQMQKTTGSDNDTASDYYKSLQRTEQAEQMAQTGKGLGIQDLILDQIYPKSRRSEMAHNAYKQQQAAQMGNRPSFIRMDKVDAQPEDIKMAVDKAIKNREVSNEESQNE
jgi:Rod binding domain-containing protein